MTERPEHGSSYDCLVPLFQSRLVRLHKGSTEFLVPLVILQGGRVEMPVLVQIFRGWFLVLGAGSSVLLWLLLLLVRLELSRGSYCGRL